jgi:DNA ligase-1
LPINVVWNSFDYLHADVVHLPYLERYQSLQGQLDNVKTLGVCLLPWVWIKNAEQAQAWIDDCLARKYEGAIFRDPKAMHKSGRATETLNDFWRFKPTSDKDAICTAVEEAQQNNNEAKTNSLGRTERSAHKENKVGNGMIGTIIATDVETGQTIRVGPGALKHKDRIAMFKDQSLIVGHPFKYTSLDTGVLDAPRQARYKCHRPKADLALKEAA